MGLVISRSRKVSATTDSQRSASAGDGSDDWTSFDTMYSTHYPQVFSAAHDVVRIRSVAEEIAQDVFLSTWQSSGRFDPARGSIAAYLRVIARNKAIDWVRSNNARVRREERTPHASVASSSVDEDALAAIERTAVWEMLLALPAENRQLIVLSFFGGMSYRLVAAHLGLPEGTVKSRIRTGLRTLAHQHKECCQDAASLNARLD